MSFSTEMIGFVAAVLTTISFVPQVYKVWKSKSVTGISLVMYLIFFCGVLLWLVYGLIIGNAVTVLSTSIILYFLLKSKWTN